MKRIFMCIITLLFLGLLYMSAIQTSFSVSKKAPSKEIKTETVTVEMEPVYGGVEAMSSDVEMKTVEKKLNVSEEDVMLIALVTMAEAEGECEEGKRLVIDTVLNRVESSHFPDSVEGVVYQENQFTSMWNGRVDRCDITDEVIQFVREEIENRTNDEVAFFRTQHYSKYGSPLFQVGDHYFSSYD